MKKITVETLVRAPVERVWQAWTTPAEIQKWNFASPDWECPHAENDLRVGGMFTARMSACDGSASFDFAGTYDAIDTHRHIEYTMEDGRKVSIVFEKISDIATKVTETFDPEQENPVEMQQTGWQAILDNFRYYVEAYLFAE